MRNRLTSLFGSGLCLLLAACGGGSSGSPSMGTGPSGAGLDDSGLRPFLDKRLRVTQYLVVDSAGRTLAEVCGGQAEPCGFDPLIIASDGRYIIDECGGCPPGDPRYESSDWTFDGETNRLIITEDTASYGIGIAGVSGDSLKLAYPFEVLEGGAAHAMGAPPPEKSPDNRVLLTYTPE